MNDDEVLRHLLKIEAEADALVNDAQAEADRRIAAGEKQYRDAGEDRYRAEAVRLEDEFQKFKEQVKKQYQSEMEAYREKLSSMTVNAGRFSALLENLAAGEA